KAALRAFGIGASLIANATINAEVFDPFHVIGQFDVALDLPWPLPDFSAGAKLEWGPDLTPPPLPVPVKEIAIEHFKVSTSWPLPRRTDLLVPDYDDGAGFLASPAPADPSAAPPADAPVVPLDARPHVTFTRAVNDDALVGVNAQPRTPEWEQIGDPTKNQNPLQARYGLNEVVLEQWDAGQSSWSAVSRAGTTANPGGVSQLYGSWAPVPAMPGGQGTNPGQTKLWLWSRTPFDYTRRTSGEWDDWFGVAYPDYPCVPPPQTIETCFDFGGLDPAEPLTPPWTVPGSGIRLGWFSPVPLFPSVLPKPIDGLTVALCSRPKEGGGPGGGDAKLSSSVDPSTTGTGSGVALMVLLFDGPVDEVELTVVSARGAQALGVDAARTVYGPFAGGTLADPTIKVTGSAMREVAIEAPGGLCLLRVCVVTLAPGSPTRATVNEHDQHLRDALATWSGQGNVLAPNRDYRVKLVTTLDTEDLAGQTSSRTQTQYAFFRTEGPPGLANLSLPVGTAPSADVALRDSQDGDVGVDGSPASRPVLKSELNSLTPYVAQTVPPTVPAPGERPALPRPVYRAYDVGVVFNEDYVDLLYRLDRRDLALSLFDANNRPVRDAAGRLVAFSNRWGVAETLSL